MLRVEYGVGVIEWRQYGFTSPRILSLPSSPWRFLLWHPSAAILFTSSPGARLLPSRPFIGMEQISSPISIYSEYLRIENTCTKIISALATNAINGTQLDHSFRNSVQEQISRFRLWAGNIVAYKRGKSSLDHRLREAQIMRETILGILDNVAESFANSKQQGALQVL